MERAVFGRPDRGEREKIIRSLNEAIRAAGFECPKVWGEVVEDRGSQITFSALGQAAPFEEKRPMGPRFFEAQGGQGDPRRHDSRIFRPIGRSDVDRRHQARHRQGLRNSKAPRHPRHFIESDACSSVTLCSKEGTTIRRRKLASIASRFETRTRANGSSRQSLLAWLELTAARIVHCRRHASMSELSMP